MKAIRFIIFIILIIRCDFAFVQNIQDIESRFDELQNESWNTVFSDDGTNDWKNKWFLDGQRATITNMKDGMLFTAGPIERDNGSHAVLWTKQSFQGDIKIEYDYTRMDDIKNAVNIIYIQATGKGTGSYKKDISEWSNLRIIPYMRTYFKNMNLLHISYAAYPLGDDKEKQDYIRARKYPVLPGEKFGSGTHIEGDHFNTGLFKPGITYHFTIIKSGHDLYMKIEGHSQEKLCHWNTSKFETVNEGRIGFRHMWTRCAKYADITISEKSTQ